MSDDDMTAVPTVLIEALKVWMEQAHPNMIRAEQHPGRAIIVCLPKPPPTFSDETCEAFYKATRPYARNGRSVTIIRYGRESLVALYESGWLTPTDDGSFIITPPKEPT